MQRITSLTNEPKQRRQLVLENKETVDFRLYFSARQQSWFFDFTYKDLNVGGSKVVLSPNTLRNLKRLIPFGISFDTEGFTEPFQLDDFSTGRVQMYILNEQEVQDIETQVYRVGL